MTPGVALLMEAFFEIFFLKLWSKFIQKFSEWLEIFTRRCDEYS